eukprot:3406955-Prorocentrum_lima.AAC.1
MTSSLVGSEMCIRDRPRVDGADARARHRRHGGHLHHEDGAAHDGRTACTVSYTHLTLPTICSV